MEWLGHVNKTDETVNIRPVAEMKMGRKTQVEMGGYSQKIHESLEYQNGMGH